MTYHNPNRASAGARLSSDAQSNGSYDNHSIDGVIATLYGDYELIIDGCLGGDPELKRKVARADRNGRGGLPILLNVIANRKVTLSPWHQEVIARCKTDQEYHEAQQE